VKKNILNISIYLAIIFFIILPVVYTIFSMFFGDSSFTENIKQLDKNTFLLLAKSILLAFTVASFTIFFGAILAFMLYKIKTRFSNFFKLVLLIPLFISPYILAVAYKDFFYLLLGNCNLISSFFGVILVLTFVYTPLSILIIGSALSNINSQIEESGFIITSFNKVMYKIILPLVKPALISSFILVFIFSLSEFSVPAFFGVKVFTTEIFTQFSAFYNHSLAILQSLFLIIICVSLLFADRKYLSKASFLSIGNKGTKSKFYKLKNPIISNLFLTTWLILSVVLPFIVLFIQAFLGGDTNFLKALELLLPTFASSFFLAFIGAIIIVFVGFVVANYSVKYKKTDWVLLIVFAIPSTIYGISLIKFYNQPMLNFIYSGYAIIIIAYVGKFSFISTKIIENALKQIPKSLDEAAQIASISNSSRIRKILIPLILPALFASFIISFIFSIGELGTTIMLYPPGTEIMPIKVYTIMANAPQSLTSSMTLIVFSVSLLMISGFYLISKLAFKKYVDN